MHVHGRSRAHVRVDIPDDHVCAIPLAPVNGDSDIDGDCEAALRGACELMCDIHDGNGDGDFHGDCEVVSDSKVTTMAKRCQHHE